jgi:hypothetical protein
MDSSELILSPLKQMDFRWHFSNCWALPNVMNSVFDEFILSLLAFIQLLISIAPFSNSAIAEISLFSSVGYVTLWSIWGHFSLSQVQNFLGDEGDCRPLKSQNRRGHTPLVYILDRGRFEKVVTFFNNICQTKASVGGLNMAFFHHLRQQKREGVKKALKGVYIG